jgi:uncharacterized membrane protein
MAAIFEWFFKYRPILYEKGAFAFHPLWPSYVTWILVAAAIAGSFALYRRSAVILPRSWRYGLSGLRAAAFLVLLIILLQPALRIRSVIPQESFVAVVYDLSKSMEIHDGDKGQSRLQVEQHILSPKDNRLLKELAAKFKLRFFRFSSTAQRTEAFEDVPRHGNITNLGRSLTQVSEELAAVPVAGIVLITDGVDNRSANLNLTASDFSARNIPVYTVGIGSNHFSRDVEILRITAPQKVLKDTIVEAEVSVRSTGYAGRRTKLVVLDQDKQLHSQEIALGSDGEVKTYKVDLNNHLAGPRVLKFRVVPLPDEVVLENNDQDVLIRVEDTKPEILYVEGEPRWEYGFLRRAIFPDKNLRVVTLLRQADGKFLRQGIESPSILEKGFPVDKKELFKYRAIILGSVEASFFTFDQLRMISDFVSQRGGGFLMLGGKSSFGQGGYINTPLEDVLPVVLGKSADSVPEFQDSTFKVRLTSYGLEHPICRLSLSEDQNRKRWDAAPDLVGFNPTLGPKPGATVLAHGSVPDSRGENPVILAFQRFGKGKSVAFTTASSWRWKMEQDHTDNFHEIFWRQMLRWLVSDVSDPITVSPEKHSYSPDDIVVLRLEANNPSFMPLNNVQVAAQVKAPSGKISSVPLAWETDKDGVFSGTFQPQEEGIYEVSCEVFDGDKMLGTAKTNFRIADSIEEYHDAAQNSSLLKRLSAETGGRFYSPNDLQTLPEDISYINKGFSRLETKDLWDMPFLFIVLIGLVSAEWVFRKRKGLQ